MHVPRTHWVFGESSLNQIINIMMSLNRGFAHDHIWRKNVVLSKKVWFFLL